MSILRDLGLWFWHLLPANPILVRVVAAGGKRSRHLYARFAYLAVLFVVLLVAGSANLGQAASLAQLAKESSRSFMIVSLVQLGLMAFIAPIFTAGAITQEKDANTFHILLTTPLSNAQIVLGSLFSRLYFVWVLLLSGLPIFCITMIYGGVTLAEVRDSLLLAACTGLVTGALAITIAVTRVGTRRTIFSFFVGVAVYLVGLWLIGNTPFGQLAAAPDGEDQFLTGRPMKMSWLAPLHPFMALLVVTGITPAPRIDQVALYGWPWSWMLAWPQYGYMAVTTLFSAALVLYSLAFVRRGAKEGEVTLWSRITAPLRRAVNTDERRRRPRNVWNNPIAWREAATRASAGGRSTMRWVLVAAAAIAGVVLVLAAVQGWWGLTPATARAWLVYLVWIELIIVLLFVTTTAATSLTREKEALTFELLLTTPLTSRYIIAGMLRGLVSFVVPLIAVPTGTVLLFLVADLLRADFAAVTGDLQALVSVPVLMISYAATAAMIGLYFSLVARKTVQAVMVSACVVLLATAILTGCGYTVAQASAEVGAFAYPFAPLPAFVALIDPAQLLDLATRPAPGEILRLRFSTLIGTVLAIAAFAAITYSQYTNLVRNFDMTIRRQTA